jgi:hypothetical protein
LRYTGKGGEIEIHGKAIFREKHGSRFRIKGDSAKKRRIEIQGKRKKWR